MTQTDDKFTWNSGDFMIERPTETGVNKSHLRVIHFAANVDLPESVRSKIPDDAAQTLFRNTFNQHAVECSEMLAYARAYKALDAAGYKQNDQKQWVMNGEVGKKLSSEELERLAAKAHGQWVLSMQEKGIKSRKSNSGEELMVPYHELSQDQKDIDRNTVLAIVGKGGPTLQQVHVNRPLGSEEEKDDPGTQDVDPPSLFYFTNTDTIQNPHDPRNENEDQESYPNHQQKDDVGTQDVDPPYEQHVPNYAVIKRISGSSQIPLNDKGEALAARLGVHIAERGGLDVLYCSTLARGKETAHEIVEANPHTVLAKPTADLIPWKLGSIEGKKAADVNDLIKHYIEHPDDRPPGKGADNEPAETFNESKQRQLKFWGDLYKDFEADPTLKIGVICHGRGLDLLTSWIEEGCPDDFDLDGAELFNPAEVDHASMMRWHKDEINEVDLDEDDSLKPGIYPILHSLTDDDNDEGNTDLNKGGPGSGPQGGQQKLQNLQQLHDAIKSTPIREGDDPKEGTIRYIQEVGKLKDAVQGYIKSARVPASVKESVIDRTEKGSTALSQATSTKWYNADLALSYFHDAIRSLSRQAGMVWKNATKTYLPPVEVHRAAKSAYDAGVSIIGITAPLAEGEGLTETGVRQIAKFFHEIEVTGTTVPKSTENAWGGYYASKWVKRVLKKVIADHINQYPRWIAVDLDNTLAEPLDDYSKDNTKIGVPKKGPFLEAVRQAVKDGKSVRIFTARVYFDPDGKVEAAVKAWSKENLGEELPVTCEKDPGMVELWDDRAHNPEDFKKAATSCMVCFDIPRTVGEQIQVPGGEDPSDMHVTLAYLGKEVPLDKLDELKALIKSFAANYAPITGTVSGPTRFHATKQSDGTDVCVANFSSVSMQDFRKMLVKRLENADFLVTNNFSYTPHVTLKYIGPKDKLPVDRVDPIDVTFNRVSLWYGDDISSFPLSGTLIAKRLLGGTIVEATQVNENLVWAHVSAQDGNQFGVFFNPMEKHIQLGDELSWESDKPSVCILGSVSDGTLSTDLPFYVVGSLTDTHGKETPITKCFIDIAKETGSKEGSWITVNGQHILIGADGKPLAGNPRLLGRKVSAKVDIARKSAVLTGKHEQDIADRVEIKVAKAIGVPRTKNNSAFDLRADKIGVEVKTMTHGKNDKITMGKSALARKQAEIKKGKLKAYTVVADMRGRTSAKYYFSDRLGSLRLGTMHQLSLAQIKQRIHGERPSYW